VVVVLAAESGSRAFEAVAVAVVLAAESGPRAFEAVAVAVVLAAESGPRAFEAVAVAGVLEAESGLRTFGAPTEPRRLPQIIDILHTHRSGNPRRVRERPDPDRRRHWYSPMGGPAREQQPLHQGVAVSPGFATTHRACLILSPRQKSLRFWFGSSPYPGVAPVVTAPLPAVRRPEPPLGRPSQPRS
jgi:hypothetical protein